MARFAIPGQFHQFETEPTGTQHFVDIAYADQSERDHEVLIKAVRAGKLEVFIEER